MRPAYILLLLVFISCRYPSGKENLRTSLPGNWLVVTVEHELNGEGQEDIYGEIQDSIILAKGLKLVSFFENGGFQQMDSLQRQGRWAISPADELYVIKGGAGFNDFKAAIAGYKKGVLQLVEYIHVQGETIKLVWHLKKTGTKDLFGADNNAWRKRPAAPESPPRIKQRLAAMLTYYSRYYQLVQEEATYFIRDRVLLPFDYYQHAMGMKSFNPKSDFVRLFFNEEQAILAYEYLATTIRRLRDEYPRTHNYVEEYYQFMELMAREITTIE